MAKKAFTRAERYAVWTVHGERCWLCRAPMNFAEMHIDHIIPEALEGTDKLRGVLDDFGLPSDFNINNWGNWMPAHGPCNVNKKDHVFEPAPIILKQIDVALSKSGKAQEIHDKFRTNRNLEAAFERVIQGIEDGDLSRERLMVLANLAAREHAPNRSPEMRDQPIMLAKGLTVLSQDDRQYILQGPSGMTGYRPKGDNLHSSWDCPHCGITGWSGTRCIRCGHFIDPD
ncbi:hypothetical protein HJB95_25390 [Rhizobium sp. NLR14b]|nr:hypothetical protein [Rhizobium sp. NLR14b]